jgi:signal transduction histidine kinase
VGRTPVLMVGLAPPREAGPARTVSIVASTAWDAVRAGPVRYLTSWWPLRALAYVVSGVGVGLVTLVWLPFTTLCGAVVLAPVATRPLAELERRRLALMGGPALPDPHRDPDRPGFGPWLRLRYTETVTWRELAYAVLHATVLLALDTAATIVGLVLPTGLLVGALIEQQSDVALFMLFPTMIVVCVGVCVVPAVAIGHSEIARRLLGSGADETIRTLTRSRARLADAFEVERRRIERDLHDGAQQRLVALTITLGLAKLERDDAEAAHTLVVQAGEQAKAALAELRALIRGIHPRVLTELGLPAAVAELAEGCGLPLTITLDVPRRLPSTVESTAYFVVAEALTNTARHAQATRIRVTGAVARRTLTIEVHDDGIGGADPAAGSGLTGLADRVDAHGGTLTISSPRGGPTILRLELPCSA